MALFWLILWSIGDFMKRGVFWTLPTKRMSLTTLPLDNQRKMMWHKVGARFIWTKHLRNFSPQPNSTILFMRMQSKKPVRMRRNASDIKHNWNTSSTNYFSHHGSGKWLYLKKGNYHWRYTYFSVNHEYRRKECTTGLPQESINSAVFVFCWRLMRIIDLHG